MGSVRYKITKGAMQTHQTSEYPPCMEDNRQSRKGPEKRRWVSTSYGRRYKQKAQQVGCSEVLRGRNRSSTVSGIVLRSRCACVVPCKPWNVLLALQGIRGRGEACAVSFWHGNEARETRCGRAVEPMGGVLHTLFFRGSVMFRLASKRERM